MQRLLKWTIDSPVPMMSDVPRAKMSTYCIDKHE